MNKKLITLIALPVLLLTSCTSIFNSTGEAKILNVYDLDLLEEEKDIETAKQGEVKARFLNNKEYVPYISLKQYADFYKSHFAKNVESTVKKEGLSNVVWSVSVDDELCFAAQISVLTKEIYMVGSIDAAFKEDDSPMDTKALSYGLNTDYEAIRNGSYNCYDYSGYDINYFSFSGEYYFPLTFFDLTFSENSGVYFYYNYNSIYSTHDVDNFSAFKFKVNNKSYTVDSQMKEARTALSMPNYLKQLNANMFFYLMDNFYGLKENKGFTSMEKLCRNNNIYDGLLSNSASIRAQSYADALSLFDDNHTALVSANDTWGEDEFGNFKYAPGCINRYKARDQITSIRASQYKKMNKDIGDIIISDDGTTAMYVFDNFVFGSSEEVFNADESINYEKARLSDSFFDLVYVFNYLKTTSVKNVILDMSLNGGGVLGVLLKILCLLSKDDRFLFYYYESNSGQLVLADNSVDINGDEKYDTDDCFGDDFNFYLLTSDCSFSCGNALPCYAKENGLAKIIGQKSGGGECAIAIHYLPNSQYVYHSSHLHIGNYNENTKAFTGFEGGAAPDIAINNYADYYDIEKLNDLIKTA